MKSLNIIVTQILNLLQEYYNKMVYFCQLYVNNFYFFVIINKRKYKMGLTAHIKSRLLTLCNVIDGS